MATFLRQSQGALFWLQESWGGGGCVEGETETKRREDPKEG